MADSEWTVAAESAGQRLDKFLAASDRAGSRGRAATALERGKVLVNGSETGPADGARRLTAGDVVRLWMDRPGSSRTRRESVAIGTVRILYEDDWLFVLDKPAGMLAVPLERRSTSLSAYEVLENHLRSQGKRRPFVVHRIDEETSGLVVFARDPSSQAALKAQFRRREPQRVYRAVVYGHPEPAEGTWRDYLVWDEKALIQKQTHARDPLAKEAISHYAVLETFRDASLIDVQLETGKRNQIRLQARLRGHTLVGERRYVYGPGHLRPIDFPRHALHAYRLAFQHPHDGRELRFEAPLPSDLLDLLSRLRRG
jgi:23S rRNA pseudouridine1911/1915/1917 synthase